MIVLRDKDFSKKSKSNEEKAKTAGKVAMGVGTGAAVAGGITENIIANKVVEKAAKKVGGYKDGFGVSSGIRVPLRDPVLNIVNPDLARSRAQQAANRGMEMAQRTLKANKGFRRAVKADKIGTGVALAGSGLYAAGKLAKKKNKD